MKLVNVVNFISYVRTLRGKNYPLPETCTARRRPTPRPVRAPCWLIHFLDREPLEVWFSPAADHDEALVGYPDAVAAEPLLDHAGARQSAAQSAQQSAQESAQQSTARGCSTCRHRKRPGLSAGYCGGGRDDLPGAYGLHHPLRKLPADEGESCASYLPHEG